MTSLYDVIIRPILSEKSFSGVKNKCYTFQVQKAATKGQIKAAVENCFKGVRVQSVRTMNYDGKWKRQGRNEGQQSAWKKAVVQLAPESKAIEFFEGLQ